MGETTRKNQEQQSFNPQASVNMFVHDLDNYGKVLAETKERVLDEDLSLWAEGINRASRTSFTMQQNQDGLIYFKDGKWRPYTGMLLIGEQAAAQEAANDPRRSFQHDWAVRDLKYGYKLNSMQPGDRLNWRNDYPHHQAQLYGADFMEECGLKPERKMGFMYQAVCNEDGSVTLDSQTVDLSDPEALAAVDQALRHHPDADLDTQLRHYDGHLKKRFGQNFYAGRTDTEMYENIWTTILAQRDLAEYHLEKIEEFAGQQLAQPWIDLTSDLEAHLVGVWKALKNRIEGKAFEATTILAAAGVAVPEQRMLELEVQASYNQARAQADWLTACGGTIKGKSFDEMSLEDKFNMIFGDKSSNETYKFDKKMYCVVCQAPPASKQEKKKPCGPCGLCRSCDKKAGGKG